MTVYAALGCAGVEDVDWFRFIPSSDGDKHYLSSTGDGAKAWFAWLEKNPNDVGPDEPPLAIIETTPQDRALLKAARANSLAGVTATLAAGAKIDCVPNIDWLLDEDFPSRPEEFGTAVTYATRHNNIEMLEFLLKRGATLNTRLLPLTVAVEHSALDTIRWLISHGARANGWKQDRHWPLHMLVERRGHATAEKAAEMRKSMTDLGVAVSYAEWISQKPVDPPTYFAMLDALLEAGADPNAPWDNGLTMLMRGGVGTAQRLLKHGADVNQRDTSGHMAIHLATAPELVRLLVAHGANVNARAMTPNQDARSYPYTPLQGHLWSQAWSPLPELIDTLLELGADPIIRDGNGRSTLTYCRTIADFKRMQAFGLDPKERLPDGGTLLHNLTTDSSIRPGNAGEVAFFEFLLSLGPGINAVDTAGQTILHRLAPRELTQPDGIRFMLDHGADVSIKDKTGKRAFDLAPLSHSEVRELLK